MCCFSFFKSRKLLWRNKRECAREDERSAKKRMKESDSGRWSGNVKGSGSDRGHGRETEIGSEGGRNRGSFSSSCVK